jgi:hypothetical protein
VYKVTGGAGDNGAGLKSEAAPKLVDKLFSKLAPGTQTQFVLLSAYWQIHIIAMSIFHLLPGCKNFGKYKVIIDILLYGF